MTDEELTATGVLAGVRHRQRPGDVLVRVLRRFALDCVSGTTCPDGSIAALRIGIAALNHEVGDYAVEFGPVVKVRVGEFLEICHRPWDLVREELHLDGALGGVDYGLLVRHPTFPR